MAVGGLSPLQPLTGKMIMQDSVVGQYLNFQQILV